MPSEKNVATVNLLKTKLAQAKSVVTADASGLSVNLQRELRQNAGFGLKTSDGKLIDDFYQMFFFKRFALI